jgi:ATP-dependent DNA helicase RecG
MMMLISEGGAGAIDNQTYRQMADCDILKASAELRSLKSTGLVDSKGRGKATYYIPGLQLLSSAKPNDMSGIKNTHGEIPNTHGDVSELPALILEMPVELRVKILRLKKREHELESLQSIILEVCAIRPMKAEELATIFQKRVDYFRKKYLYPLLEQKKIRYLYPEMIKHPDQAYLTIK